MKTYLILLAAAALVAFVVLRIRGRRLRQAALERLSEAPVIEETVVVRERGSVLNNYQWLALLLGAAAGIAARVGFGLPWVYGVAVAVIAGVVFSIVEGWRAGQKILRLETQLADAIDLMVGSLNAGASAMEAMALAAREAGRPLEPLLDEISGRVRLGDDPQALLHELAQRVPLHTFRLFCFTLSVHWEVGGSLSPILSGVGKTIRDRIELTRRIRSQRANAQMSVVGILAISYFVALVMWKTNPVRTEIFLASRIGATLVAVSVVMQAIGMLWMARLSRIRL